MRWISASVLSLLLLSALPASASADKIGTVLRVQGTPTAVLNGKTRKLVTGAAVNRDETVTGGAKSRIKIEFTDKSTVVLGEEAKLVIDELVFSPQRKRQAFKFLTGAFRFTSGAIAQANSANVSLTTPVATIGIRGTDLIGGYFFAGMPPGQTHYGVLLVSGAVSVETPHGGIVLDEPGEGTFMPNDGSKAPTPPRLWQPTAMTEAFGAILFR